MGNLPPSTLPPIYKGGKVDTSQDSNAALVTPVQSGARDAGSGQHIQTAAERTHIWDVSPRQRQLMLRSMGYNVKVDGKSGPQTASAAWAYVHGHNAGFFNHQGRDWQQSIWNTHFSKFHETSSPHDTAGVSSPSGAGTPTHVNNSETPQRSDAPFSGLGEIIGGGITELNRLARGGTLVDPKQGALVGTMLDPQGEGAAAAEAKYGQSLRENARLIANLPGQADQNQADIKSWYGTIGGKAKAAADANAAMADSLIKSSGAASAGLVNALGGDANASAADLASAGEQETGTLRALKLAGAIGSSDIASAIGGEGLSARTRQRLADANSLTDARNKQTDLNAQSGAESTLARGNAIAANNLLEQTRYGNRMGAIGQNNELVNARAQRTAAALSAAEGAALLPSNLSYKNAQTAAALAKANGTGKLPKGAFDNTDAKTKGAVADLGVKSVQAILANKGTPEDAVKAVNDIYRTRGWSLKNPRVVKAVMSTLRAAGVTPDPSWWAKFGYKG